VFCDIDSLLRPVYGHAKPKFPDLDRGLSLAEYERDLINERAAAAREAARARGKHTGRPEALTAEQVALAQRMHGNRESVPTIMQTLGVSRATVYRALSLT
jgi:DNA invertase Pin-like site-specific DNA recombinase